MPDIEQENFPGVQEFLSNLKRANGIKGKLRFDWIFDGDRAKVTVYQNGTPPTIFLPTVSTIVRLSGMSRDAAILKFKGAAMEEICHLRASMNHDSELYGCVRENYDKHFTPEEREKADPKLQRLKAFSEQESGKPIESKEVPLVCEWCGSGDGVIQMQIDCPECADGKKLQKLCSACQAVYGSQHALEAPEERPKAKPEEHDTKVIEQIGSAMGIEGPNQPADEGLKTFDLSPKAQKSGQQKMDAFENSEEKGYQGWTNWETWAANLWLANDQAAYEEAQRMAGQGPGAWARWLTEKIQDGGIPDLYTHHIDKVNFEEIRKAFLPEPTYAKKFHVPFQPRDYEIVTVTWRGEKFTTFAGYVERGKTWNQNDVDDIRSRIRTIYAVRKGAEKANEAAAKGVFKVEKQILPDEPAGGTPKIDMDIEDLKARIKKELEAEHPETKFGAGCYEDVQHADRAVEVIKQAVGQDKRIEVVYHHDNCVGVVVLENLPENMPIAEFSKKLWPYNVIMPALTKAGLINAGPSKYRTLPGNKNMIAWPVLQRYGENPFTMLDDGRLRPVRLPPGTYDVIAKSKEGYFVRLDRKVPGFSNLVEVPQKYMEHVGGPRATPHFAMTFAGGMMDVYDIQLRSTYQSTLQYVGLSEWMGKVFDIFKDDATNGLQ